MPTSPVYCSHFTLGNLKVIFQQYYSHILQIIYIISEEKLLLPYPPHLKNVTALPCTMHKFFYLFHFFTRIEYQSAKRTSCGSVLLRHGLNFSTAWWTMQLINGEKDWKHVGLSTQKVVTLNTCCNVACLTFHLPHITSGSFQSHQCQPTTGFISKPPTFGGMQHSFSQMKKLCILQGSAVTFFQVWWVRR